MVWGKFMRLTWYSCGYAHSGPGTGEPPVTLLVRLAVAYLRLIKLVLRRRVLTPERARRLAVPFYWSREAQELEAGQGNDRGGAWPGPVRAVWVHPVVALGVLAVALRLPMKGRAVRLSAVIPRMRLLVERNPRHDSA
jgi:hypothetical protein